MANTYCLWSVLLFSLGLVSFGTYFLGLGVPYQKPLPSIKRMLNVHLGVNDICEVNKLPAYKISRPRHCVHDVKNSNCSCINLDNDVTNMVCNKKIVNKINRTIYLATMGRLGNTLFVLAGGYAMAKDTNSQLVVLDREILNIFENKPFKTINKTQWKSTKANFINGRHKLADYKKALKIVLSSNVVKFQHYTQRFAYFGVCDEEIRQKLALKKSIITVAVKAILSIIKKHIHLLSQSCNNSSFLDLNSSDFTTVGIQVRKGDLTNKVWYKDGYRHPDVSYYTKAMDYFKSQYSNVIFIVATNGKGWVKKHLLRPGVYLSPLKTAEEDMALVAKCNHAITSLGTYSWWSGFYNEGTVVYYKNWIAPNSSLWRRMEYKHNERFPPYWIPIT